MLIIDEEARIEESQDKFWHDELENSKILLNEVNKAIFALTKDVSASGGVQSYTLNTGQDSQTVTRADLSSLYRIRKELLSVVTDLEKKLGLRGSAARIIVPAF